MKRIVLKTVLTAFFVLLTLQNSAFAIPTDASHALIVDATTGTILLNKNSDEIMYPASMSKIMTIYILFEHLKDGRLKMDDTFEVSEKAWRKGGSKMFVEVGKRVKVKDLLYGIIVQSGNDACIVLAEGLMGSEESFADEMNRKAEELGMTSTHFENSTGWPDPDHITTAKDLAILTRHLINDFPEYYPLFAETEYTYNEIKQGNRNPLLYKNIGADGVKTGHTEASGYGLVGSAQEDRKRVILVVNGLDSARDRSTESERLIRWAFREYDNYDLFAKGDVIDDASVWLGTEASVPLVVENNLTLSIPHREMKNTQVRLEYNSPIKAPIRKGQQLAELKIKMPEREEIILPVVAGKDVEKLGGLSKLQAAFEYLLWGNIPSKTQVN